MEKKERYLNSFISNKIVKISIPKNKLNRGPLEPVETIASKIGIKIKSEIKCWNPFLLIPITKTIAAIVANVLLKAIGFAPSIDWH